MEIPWNSWDLSATPLFSSGSQVSSELPTKSSGSNNNCSKRHAVPKPNSTNTSVFGKSSNHQTGIKKGFGSSQKGNDHFRGYQAYLGNNTANSSNSKTHSGMKWGKNQTGEKQKSDSSQRGNDHFRGYQAYLGNNTANGSNSKTHSGTKWDKNQTGEKQKSGSSQRFPHSNSTNVNSNVNSGSIFSGENQSRNTFKSNNSGNIFKRANNPGNISTETHSKSESGYSNIYFKTESNSFKSNYNYKNHFKNKNDEQFTTILKKKGFTKKPQPCSNSIKIDDVRKNPQSVYADSDSSTRVQSNSLSEKRSEVEQIVKTNKGQRRASTFSNSSDVLLRCRNQIYENDDFQVHSGDFLDPPQLISNDSELQMGFSKSIETMSNSQRSESIMSAGQLESEKNILNQIYELKSSLHSLEIKPSMHVLLEIAGLEKYIKVIVGNWKDASRVTLEFSSDTKSSEDVNKKETEKRKIQRKRDKKKKSEGHESDSDSQVKTKNKSLGGEVSQREFSTPQPAQKSCQAKKMNSPLLECTNISQQKVTQNYEVPFSEKKIEKTVQDKNTKTYFSDSIDNASASTTLDHNKRTITTHSVQNVTKTCSEISQLMEPGVDITDNKTDKNKIDKILLNIRYANVTLSRKEVNLINSELDKIKNVDSTNVSKPELSQNLVSFNLCVAKVIEIETISREVKHEVLALLKDYLMNICDADCCHFVDEMIEAYEARVDTVNRSEKTVVDSSPGEVLPRFPENESFFESLENFEEGVLERINSACKELEGNAEESESEGEDVSSDEEKRDTDEELETLPRGKNPPRLSTSLSPQCEAFLACEGSIVAQVDHLLCVFQTYAKESNVSRDVLFYIKNAIKSTYPNCCLYVFGSRASNMALPDSDVDIFMDVTGQAYFNGALYDEQQEFVKKIVKNFYRNPAGFSDVFGLRQAKVPIIKVYHKTSSLNCDISFKNGTSVENTKLLNYYLDIDERVRWLIAAIKLWAQYNQVYGSTYFNSHSLNWLVLFFLMREMIVPPIICLKGCPAKYIAGWDVAFQPVKLWMPCSMEKLVLFKKFFRFLTIVSWESNMMCPYTGEIIPKTKFNDLEWLEHYSDGIFKAWVDRIRATNKKLECHSHKGKFYMNKLIDETVKQDAACVPLELNDLCIQDPFEFSKNVSHQVKAEKFTNFKLLCHKTDAATNFIKLN